MKRTYIYVGLMSLLLSIGACSNETAKEPHMPTRSTAEIGTAHTISELKSLYTGSPTTISQEYNVVATVASDDSEGNLYKTFYVEDATGGIELKLGMGNLSTLYPQGSKILIRCQGMTLGKYADHINLGYASKEERYETAYYPELMVTHKALQLISPGQISPRKLSLGELSAQYAGTLVTIDNLQFVSSDLGQTYANPLDKKNNANVNRTLTDRAGKTIIVRTSSYAKFAGKPLPNGSGSITALLTYFRTTPQLIVLREADVNFNQPRF